jgi:hypothetical protein
VAVASALLLSLCSSAADLMSQGRRIREIVGEHPPRSLGGRLLAVRFHLCDKEPGPSFGWGAYDPLWHVWAYGVNNFAATPQTFAFSRYHYVQFRSERYDKVAGPPDSEILSDQVPGQRCVENNAFRLMWALSSRQYDAVLAVQMPASLLSILTRASNPRLKITPLSPGLLVLQVASPAAHPRAP